VGGFPITPPIAIGSVVFGALLIFAALRSRPIRNTKGVAGKLRLLAGDYGNGPDQMGRVFFAGIAFLVIGIMALALKR
jgi:hypothetical protein